MDTKQYMYDQEVNTMTEMIGIFCRDVHKTADGELCPECQELLDYVQKRIYSCPHADDKVLCNDCRTHCFAPNRQQKLKQIMRYSGSKLDPNSPFAELGDKFISWLRTIQDKGLSLF